MTVAWRFASVSEADFEPLLALRIDVMREHLERVFRYSPERARRFFREAFDQPGMRLILLDDERVGCVGVRIGDHQIQIDSFYLSRRLHDRGLGGAILDALLAEADALRRPVRLDVLRGSPAARFYERRGFVKVSEDEIEGRYERPAASAGMA